MLCKTEWSWELRTWSHKMNLLDILSTSTHNFCRKWILPANENSYFDLRVLGVSVHAQFSVDEQIRVLTTKKLDKTFQLLFTNHKHALFELLNKNNPALRKPLNNDMSIVRHCRWRVGLRWAGGCKAWFSLTHKHTCIRTYARAAGHIWLNSRYQLSSNRW